MSVSPLLGHRVSFFVSFFKMNSSSCVVGSPRRPRQKYMRKPMARGKHLLSPALPCPPKYVPRYVPRRPCLVLAYSSTHCYWRSKRMSCSRGNHSSASGIFVPPFRIAWIFAFWASLCFSSSSYMIPRALESQMNTAFLARMGLPLIIAACRSTTMPTHASSSWASVSALVSSSSDSVNVRNTCLNACGWLSRDISGFFNAGVQVYYLRPLSSPPTIDFLLRIAPDGHDISANDKLL
jgi:hypothetical protein